MLKMVFSFGGEILVVLIEIVLIDIIIFFL